VVLQDGDVVQGVTVDQEQVGEVAGLDLAELTRAVMTAAAIGTTSSDAIALIVAQRAERAVTLFALDGRPHLQAFALEPPDLAAYAALKAQGAAS